MPFDYDSAIEAGATPEEINAYLSSKHGFDYSSAKDAGASDDEIFSYLSGKDAGVAEDVASESADLSAVPPDQDSAIVQGWNQAKSGAGFSKDIVTGDLASAAKGIASSVEYQAKNPGSQASQGLGKAWEEGEGFWGGVGSVMGKTAADIEDLGDREHVRLRTQIYLGSMHPTTYQIPILTEDKLCVREVEFIPAVYKAIGEVVDNCLDEFSQITAKTKLLKIEAIPEAGQYTIIDNGRGIPIEQKVDRHGKQTWVPELVLSRLRSGRNFKEGKEVGVIGQNGVGAACTNYCSSEFEVVVHRDKKKYHQKFIDGVEKVSRPKAFT